MRISTSSLASLRRDRLPVCQILKISQTAEQISMKFGRKTDLNPGGKIEMVLYP